MKSVRRGFAIIKFISRFEGNAADFSAWLVAKGTVLVPISSVPDDSRLIGVPDIVTPGPPAEIMVLPIANSVGLGVKTWPPTVYTPGVLVLAAIATLSMLAILVPIFNIPDGSRIIGVPEIVAPGPPADMVVPSIVNAIGFGVKS